MGAINVGHLYRKRTVRKLDGTIYDLVDEADGGVIISKGRVVNQERINEMAKKEMDRKTAATAQTQQVAAPVEKVEERAVAPSKMQELEKRIDLQDAKLDAILAALKK